VTSRTRFVIYLVLALAFVLLSAANAAQRRAVPAVAYTLCAAVLAALAARARPRP
jgi:succinate-acetate transporter protein